MGALALAATGGCVPPEDDATVPGDIDMEDQAVSGENQAGSNLSGANLGGNNLGGVNLGGVNLGGSNLGGNNLGGVNLGGTNLGGNNLGGVNLGGSNLGGVNLGGVNLGGVNLAGKNLGGSNLGGSNVAGANLAGNKIIGTTLNSTNLSGTNSGANIHNLASAKGMLYSGEDLWSTKPYQCVVMGLGSTAFAKLLGQQTANTKIYAAVGKLPWGFANTSGGSVVLRAWEATVWGDKTYCTFVIGAPTSATWQGVAGFIKAVFRWNAPPSQSISISGIEASKPHDSGVSTSISTYTGMMNAAAHYRAGKISAKNMLAGTLGFVTATTNNRTVKVDFASWVADSSKSGMILGNVQSSSPPVFAESVYYVVDNGDGTVATLVTAASPRTFNITNIYDSYSDIKRAFDVFWNGGLRPTARRCGGALYLKFLAPGDSSYASAAASKCDSGLVWSPTEVRTGDRAWSTVSGTTAPMNGYMRLPKDSSTTFMRGTSVVSWKPVLSETYIHLWEQGFDYPVTSSTCASAYAQSKCPTYNAGTKVSYNGRNYICVDANCGQCGASASCAPGKAGCAWGLVWNDNGACN